MELKEEQKQRLLKWVQALESGQYRQARLALRAGDGFCCLGVACDVYAQETGNGHWVDDVFAIKHDVYADILPEAVADWFGIAPNPVLIEFARASDMNDEGHASFKEIARAIREKFDLPPREE